MISIEGAVMLSTNASGVNPKNCVEYDNCFFSESVASNSIFMIYSHAMYSKTKLLQDSKIQQSYPLRRLSKWAQNGDLYVLFNVIDRL